MLNRRSSSTPHLLRRRRSLHGRPEGLLYRLRSQAQYNRLRERIMFFLWLKKVRQELLAISDDGE